MAQGLYLDLAVGTHPAGAETWEDRSSFARGVSLGAPPDAFAPDGQSWSLAPFEPHALAAQGFEAFAETLRAQLRFAGMLRIDHILGFERAYWVPQGAHAGLPGAYVRMPREALLAITRLEAARAGAVIVGEDLGVIPDGLREALDASGLLGCRILQFEHEDGVFADPAVFPPLSLASFGTHDLPTFRGWREGADIAAREAAGSLTPRAADRARAERTALVRALARVAGGRSVDRMHALLARAGSLLVALQAEDVLDVRDQVNLPGTVDDYPNWRQRLPVAASELARVPRLRRAAAMMRREGRAPGSRDPRGTCRGA